MQQINALHSGCILAGGKSVRMGTNKALLELDGKTLLSIAVEKMSWFQELLISAANPEDYSFTGIRIVPDERPGIGPLGGIISALKATDTDLICFRPVDAPLFPSELHRIITEACFGKDAAVPVFGGLPEPLFSCYSKTALPALEKLAEENTYKVAEAFPLLDVHYLDLESPQFTARFGDPGEYLINLNTLKAFSQIKQKNHNATNI